MALQQGTDKRHLLLLIALCIAIAGCKGKEVIGTPAADFTLEGINGGKISYSELKGRPLLLYFFASW